MKLIVNFQELKFLQTLFRDETSSLPSDIKLKIETIHDKWFTTTSKMVTGCLKFTQSIYSWLKQKSWKRFSMLTQIRNHSFECAMNGFASNEIDKSCFSFTCLQFHLILFLDFKRFFIPLIHHSQTLPLSRTNLQKEWMMETNFQEN
jgi:hypothetical protein